MARFAKVENQAHRICCELANNGKEFRSLSADEKNSYEKPMTHSVNSFNRYKESLTVFGNYEKAVSQNHRVDLYSTTIEQVKDYLQMRAAEVKQSTLDADRQALQKLLELNGELKKGETIEVIKSELKTELRPRAYTPEQVQKIVENMSEKAALSTEIAYNAGLRAHELFCIERVGEKEVTYRPEKDNEKNYGSFKHEGRENTVAYVVTGKGGHVREIRLSKELADRLEERRLDTPKQVCDRGVFYETKYDLAGGKSLSNSFSNASNDTLGFSNGFHGLRHSYAQERMDTLEKTHSHEEAKAIDSMELGHYRSDITDTYLR